MLRFIQGVIVFNCIFAAAQSEFSYSSLDIGVGEILPIYSDQPKSHLQKTFTYSLGKIYDDSLSSWHAFYRNPHGGVELQINDHGNPHILGYSVNIMPFFVINMSEYLFRSSHMKFAIGPSYFTKTFNLNNETNLSVGSHVMVAFTGEYSYAFKLQEQLNLTAGLRFMHYSNGHTQLPNFGVNSFQLTTGIQFIPKSQSINDKIKVRKVKKDLSYDACIIQGYGWHELGDAVNPINGPKYPIYSYAAYGSKVFNNSLRLKIGLSYRFYQSYYSHIKKRAIQPYYSNINASASNVVASFGAEMLFGHVGTELEVGVNLLKKGYMEYNRFYNRGKKDDAYVLRKWIPMRLGINYYVINTKSSPLNNVVVGSHINANWIVADFISFSLGYVRKLK